MPQRWRFEWKAKWNVRMGELSLHAVGRGIFQMEEAKTMGSDHSNESRHSLPMVVGNDKRVDRKNKASSDCSVNVLWDPIGRNLVERSWVFNPLTAIRWRLENEIFNHFHKRSSQRRCTLCIYPASRSPPHTCILSFTCLPHVCCLTFSLLNIYRLIFCSLRICRLALFALHIRICPASHFSPYPLHIRCLILFSLHIWCLTILPLRSCPASHLSPYSFSASPFSPHTFAPPHTSAPTRLPRLILFSLQIWASLHENEPRGVWGGLLEAAWVCVRSRSCCHCRANLLSRSVAPLLTHTHPLSLLLSLSRWWAML